MQGAINDVGLRAVIRDGKRGFRMVIGGGLGPLPVEAQLLDEFVPEERLVNRCEAVIRVFNQYGNRKNKNKARLKFVMRERGFDWLREQIEKEYADILANGGIDVAGDGARGLRRLPVEPAAARATARCCRWSNAAARGDPEYDALARNQRPAAEADRLRGGDRDAWTRAT